MRTNESRIIKLKNQHKKLQSKLKKTKGFKALSLSIDLDKLEEKLGNLGVYVPKRIDNLSLPFII